MNWGDYETVTRWIYETLGSRLGVEIVGYGPSFRQIGKSRVAHQIDILTTHSDGAHAYYTAIECKYWNDKVTKDTVMKVDSINEDCNFDKSVIVTKVGFTDDAITYAKQTNVHLVELREYNLHIEGDNLIKCYMHFEIRQPEILSINLSTDNEYIQKYANHPILAKGPNDSFFQTTNNEIIHMKDLINDFLNETVLINKHYDVVSYVKTFARNTKMKNQNIRGGIPINSIQFLGYNRIYTKLDMDYFENRIWLMMNLIFEKKQLLITTSGHITNWDNGEPIQLTVGRKIKAEAKGNARHFKIRTPSYMNAGPSPS